MNYLHKEDFGQVPRYLESVRAEIESEKQLVRDMVETQRQQIMRAQPQTKLMPEDERQAVHIAFKLFSHIRWQLLADLKKRWQQVNFDFQRAAHHVQPLDTVGKVRRFHTSISFDNLLLF